jgi:hypothetical protein
MLSHVSISTLAIAMMVTSPLLHYWEHGDVAAAHSGGCCDDSHAAPCDTPVGTEQPSDDDQQCDCKYRVAVPPSHLCDIAELAAKHLAGDHATVALEAVQASGEQFSPTDYATPVHFSPTTDSGELCARLGRHLL